MRKNEHEMEAGLQSIFCADLYLLVMTVEGSNRLSGEKFSRNFTFTLRPTSSECAKGRNTEVRMEAAWSFT